MERLRASYASADYAEALARGPMVLNRRLLLFVDGAEPGSHGLGWPEGGEDLWHERATEPHHRVLP